MRLNCFVATIFGVFSLTIGACDDDRAGGVDCAAIPAAYQALIEANRSCSTNADCTVVGGPQDLSCDPLIVLGETSGDAVNRSVADEARRLIDDYQSDACADVERQGVIDAGPAANLRCDGGTCKADGTNCNDRAPIDPATLDPATVVFAATSGGGWLVSPQEEFFVGERHNSFGLWIYGDRRAIMLREDTLQTLGYRVYRQGTVTEAAFQDLLDRAAGLGLGGDHRYSSCAATDGGSAGVAVALPGVAFAASSYMGFEDTGCGGDPGAMMGDEGKPPTDLVAFATALFDVEPADPVVLEPDRIVLAGHVVETGVPPVYGCDLAATVEWTVAGVTIPEAEPMHGWTLPLEGQPARDARAFVRAHLQDHQDSSYWSACVKQGDRLYRVYYDDVPDGEADWPF